MQRARPFFILICQHEDKGKKTSEIRRAALLRNSFTFQDNSPSSELEKIRSDSGCSSDIDSSAFAKYMDYSDPLKGFRARFQYPKKSELPLGDD